MYFFNNYFCAKLQQSLETRFSAEFRNGWIVVVNADSILNLENQFSSTEDRRKQIVSDRNLIQRTLELWGTILFNLQYCRSLKSFSFNRCTCAACLDYAVMIGLSGMPLRPCWAKRFRRSWYDSYGICPWDHNGLYYISMDQIIIFINVFDYLIKLLKGMKAHNFI